MVMNYHKSTFTDKKEIEVLNQLVDELKKKVEGFQQQVGLKDGEILEKNDKINKLQIQVDELRGVIFKLSDVRNVLNRVLDPYSQEYD